MAKSINKTQYVKKRDQDMIDVVGANIVFFRKAMGLTQVKFAFLADIEPKQLYNYENGLADIGISAISNLAKAFGKQPYELLIERKEALALYKKRAE